MLGAASHGLDAGSFVGDFGVGAIGVDNAGGSKL